MSASKKLRMGLVAAAAALSATLAATVVAQTPGKPITIVIPFAPGGPGEVSARVMIPVLQEKLKSPIVIESRQGAGGAVGITSVANAPADGHTVLYTSNAITIDQAIKLKPAYDPLKDLRPLTIGVFGVQSIAINPQLAANNLREFIAHAKANPGKLNYAHAGVGSHTHMAMELFKLQAGLDIVAVPYRGGGQQALASTLANDTQLTMLPPVFFAPHVKTGRLKILLVASDQRMPLVPEVPTAAEAGMPGFEAMFWYGLFLPAATPNDIFNRIETAFSEAINAPDFKQKMQGLGYIPGGMPATAFRTRIEGEVKQWREIVGKANIPRE